MAKICPIAGYNSDCTSCAMFENQNCIIKGALRSLPAIANNTENIALTLNNLGWLERIAATLDNDSSILDYLRGE